MLKNNSWGWNDQAAATFQALKQALCSASILVLLNFQLEFSVYTDANDYSIRVVLQQQGRPVTFFNKALRVRNQTLSIYEKQMLVVLLTVRRWHARLVGRHFKTRIDHQSLSVLSDQVDINPFQQRWVVKMLRYDYEVIYRKGINNRVADAISRQHLVQGQLLQLSGSSAISSVLLRVQQSYQDDEKIGKILKGFQQQGS